MNDCLFKLNFFEERNLLNGISDIKVVGCKLLKNKGMVHLTSDGKLLYTSAEGRQEFVEEWFVSTIEE